MDRLSPKGWVMVEFLDLLASLWLWSSRSRAPWIVPRALELEDAGRADCPRALEPEVAGPVDARIPLVTLVLTGWRCFSAGIW